MSWQNASDHQKLEIIITTEISGNIEKCVDHYIKKFEGFLLTEHDKQKKYTHLDNKQSYLTLKIFKILSTVPILPTPRL